MKLHDRIANYLAPMAEPHCADAQPLRGQAASTLPDDARRGALDGVPEGSSADAAKRDDIGKAPPKLYLPACGALCDILWWARRGT